LGSSFAVPLTDSSRVADVRRSALAAGAALDFDEGDRGRVALVATEIASNLCKHARQGEVIIRPVPDGSQVVEILAVDRGPGMSNLGECMRDGYSTVGSSGTGLGSIQRVSTSFDIHSSPGQGTVLLSQISPLRPSSPAAGPVGSPRFEVSGLTVPKTGEEVAGDAWAFRQNGSQALFLIADGLGHGIDAAAAAQQAVQTFGKVVSAPLCEIMLAIHAALRPTRGAAVAVVQADLQDRVIRFVGVGNISGAILTPTSLHQMVSHHGIAGHTLTKVREFTYPWPEDSLIVLHSDGMTSHWSLSAYPGLGTRHASLIAAVLYRDFTRGRDDVTVVVARERKRPR